MSLIFEKQIKQSQRADHPASVSAATSLPCLKLVFNDNWNDYNYSTWFVLWLLKEDGSKNFIGDVKIMHRHHDDVYEVLPDRFGQLDEDFCSVGIDLNYYTNLLKMFGKDEAYCILNQLQDCIVVPHKFESFSAHPIFTASLQRDLSTKRVFEEALLLMEGRDTSSAYAFEYRFTPKYNEKVSTTWNLHIEYDAPAIKRTFAIIGINGVGKTLLLSGMVDDLVHRNKDRLSRIPLLMSVLVVCSSRFDEYRNIDQNDAKIPLNIVSLVQEGNTYVQLLASIKKILSRETFLMNGDMMMISEHYVSLLNEQLGEEIAKGLVVEEGDKSQKHYCLNENRLEELVNNMSTGQLQVFSLITYVCAYIHLSSLIIIDEPEVHLHPQLVTNFFISLNKLLERFNSYAIMPTHSPLVVRECVGRNVFLMTCTDKIPTIAEVPFNTFGEDISTLYENIFEYHEQNSYFFSVVEDMAKKGKGVEYIVKSLRKQGVKLNRNSLFVIRDCVAAAESKKQE